LLKLYYLELLFNTAGYVKLILAMTSYQLLYDLTLFNTASDVGNYPILYISQVGLFIGGIGSSIISNWIAFILFYVVVLEKPFDIMKNYMYIILSTVIIWLPLVIIYSIGALPEDSNIYLLHLARRFIYYYARLISIFLNFVMISCILYRTYQVRSKSTTKTPAEIAINTLCRRVMYYPILQAISRSGYAWYESQYGFDFRVSEAEHDPERYTALMYSAIITPTVSFGNLILFLIIEPNAYIIFKEIFYKIKKPSHDDDDNDVTSQSTTSTVHDTQTINVADNSRYKSKQMENTTSELRFSWDNIRNSVVNLFISDDNYDNYDNRTEDEIFAIINENLSINEVKRSSEMNLNEKNAKPSSSYSSSTVNIIHSSKSRNSDIELSDNR